MDERTAFWMGAFNLLNRTRPPSMGGIPPICTMNIIAMAEKLQWPCELQEAVHVLTALDDQFRDLNSTGNK